MKIYVISVPLIGGGKGYMGPRPDGNYVVLSSELGAAVWATKKSALLANINLFNDKEPLRKETKFDHTYHARESKISFHK